MADTYTSVKDGNWGSADTWDLAAVPADGDAVVVNHNVVFNVDQSAWSVGVNGLGITYGNTLSFAFDGTVTHLKMKSAKNISGAGNLTVGTEANPIPAPSTSTPAVATIALSGGGEITVTGTVTMYGEIRDGRDTTAQSQVSGDSTIVLTTGFTLRAGDVVAISRQLEGANATAHTVQSYNAGTKTVTFTGTLGRAVALGDYVGLLSRSILVQGDNTASKGAFSGAHSGSVTGVNFIGFASGVARSRDYWTLRYCTLQSFTGYNGSGSTSTGHSMLGCVSHGAGCIGNTSRTYSIESCIVFGAAYTTATLIGGGVFANCVAANCSIGWYGQRVSDYYRDCVLYYCSVGLSSTGTGTQLDGCTFVGCSTDIAFVGTSYVNGGLVNLRNCWLGGGIEVSNYADPTRASPSLCMRSDLHDQQAGALKFWSIGGYGYKQAVVQRGSRDTLQFVAELAAYHNRAVWLYTVAPGQTLTIDVWCSALDEWTSAPAAYLCYATQDPLLDSGVTPLDSAVVDSWYSGSGDRTWWSGQVSWTNTGTSDAQVAFLLTGRDAAATCYFDWAVQAAAGGGYMPHMRRLGLVGVN